MPPTSQSLLDRLQKHNDPQAWQRLVTVYEPWLRAWLSRHQLQPALPARGGADPYDLAVSRRNRCVLQQPERPLALGGLASHQLADPVDYEVCLDQGFPLDRVVARVR